MMYKCFMQSVHQIHGWKRKRSPYHIFWKLHFPRAAKESFLPFSFFFLRLMYTHENGYWGKKQEGKKSGKKPVILFERESLLPAWWALLHFEFPPLDFNVMTALWEKRGAKVPWERTLRELLLLCCMSQLGPYIRIRNNVWVNVPVACASALRGATLFADEAAIRKWVNNATKKKRSEYLKWRRHILRRCK